MKMKITFLTKTLIICSVIFLNSNISMAQLSNYASLPYYTGFENGVLDSNWYTVSSMPAGRIIIWPSDTLIWGGDTAMAVVGDKFLGMDMPTGGTLNLNQAWMGINAAGFSGLNLSFWWNDWNDETSPEDGIYISNDGGINFTKVLDLLGGSNPDLNWVYYNLNLDSINNVHGLTFSASYVIKFQQYDDYYLAGGNDGFMFDEVAVGPVITSLKNGDSKQINLYPNPAQEVLYISGLNPNSNTRVNIKNTLGQLILTEFTNGLPNMSLNLGMIPGVYFVEIIDNSGIVVKEIMKK
jgi:hypothetical protein